jgi:predicted nucleic acid-binding Zn ribbon protein
MTVKYNYKCSMCSHNYIEVRAAEESPFFTTCNSCGDGEYAEISSEVLAAEVERVAAPEPEEPTND